MPISKAVDQSLEQAIYQGQVQLLNDVLVKIGKNKKDIIWVSFLGGKKKKRKFS